jgi:hypothetical protein
MTTYILHTLRIKIVVGIFHIIHSSLDFHLRDGPDYNFEIIMKN